MEARDEPLPSWAVVVGHREWLLHRLERSGSHNGDTEDIAHETLIRAARLSVVHPDTVRGLLATIASRVIIDFRRRQSARERLVQRLGSSATPSRDAEVVALHRETAEFLADQIDQLPPRLRSVLKASADGMSLQEIADREGMSYSAAGVALHRARKRILAAIAALPVLLARLLRRGSTTTAPSAAVVAAVASAVILLFSLSPTLLVPGSGSLTSRPPALSTAPDGPTATGPDAPTGEPEGASLSRQLAQTQKSPTTVQTVYQQVPRPDYNDVPSGHLGAVALGGPVQFYWGGVSYGPVQNRQGTVGGPYAPCIDSVVGSASFDGCPQP